MEDTREFSCPTCQKTYYSSSNYTRHLKMIHKTMLPRIRPNTYSFDRFVFKCLEGCKTSYATTNRLIDHLVLDHYFDIKPQKIEFLNVQDFNKWKAELEIEHSVQYIQHNGKKVKQDAEVLHFKCNRSGVGRSDKDKNRQGRRIRGPRLKEGFKSQYCCTSHIIATTSRSTRRTSVKYVPFHYGHDLDHRLIKIPKLERLEIAKKLMQGVSISRLLEDIKSSNTEAAARISRKDLHNIKKSFKINSMFSPKNPDDMTSLNLWLESIMNDEDSPVALWKPPGQFQQEFPKMDELQFEWLEDDLCLVMMTKEQGSLLEQLAPESVVSLHTIKSDKLHIVNLMVVAVIDEWGGWLPLATLWSSRVDLEVIEAMLLVVRKMVGGDVAPRYLVTDTSTEILEVWNAALSAPVRHLYAPWHVTYSWRQALAKSKTNNADKRKEIVCILEALRDIEQVKEFETAMDEFLAMLEDEGTYCNDFFSNIFLGETEAWAKCYQEDQLRQLIESASAGQRALTYELAVGQRSKRVDAAVMAVHSLVQDKLQERLNRLVGSIPGVMTVAALHTLAMESQFQMSGNDNIWSVTDTLDRNDTVVYQCEKCCDFACTLCGICYHSYTCTCTRYTLDRTICQHIHFVHCYQNGDAEADENNSAEGEEQEEEEEDIKPVIPPPKMNSDIIWNRVKEECIQLVRFIKTNSLSVRSLNSAFTNCKSLIALLRVKNGLKGKIIIGKSKRHLITLIHLVPDLCRRITEKSILRMAYKSIKSISQLMQVNCMEEKLGTVDS